MTGPFSETMTIGERIVDNVVVLDIGGRMTLEAQESQLSGLVRHAWLEGIGHLS